MTGNDEAELSRLMRAAIAGDERAYADFLRRTAALVRGFARRKIVQGGVDPEDVVQETLLAIHVKRHTWRQDLAVLPWVYAIARFKLIDAFRRRGRRIEIEIDDIAETLAEPEAETVSERDINRALDRLPPAQRSVVSAISVEGRSISETAAKFGISETAVRVSLHRGLAAIAKRFGAKRFGRE
ncbi:RNA polymerase sigma factor [Mesorhizobium tianshanense]|uniref:RNA polymerase sigma-70 factor (ECF subfamily) n=1 Tax=Mesorhizobium tianshanense TaxID=39844 RepID=A0A562NNB6_9HYPH|nr:sigma-70 family RNA polymerase sigma factor [Mesorhizobium tianshanense]TWI33501.1 RNA polymerase sigma-70 factor (ECF subfamily) [Mesorhizobium tianshanense]GLS41323.1 RNA polymerase sigma factor [Mesorhizobium tianshanense]